MQLTCLNLFTFLGGLSPFQVFYGRQSNTVKYPLKLEKDAICDEKHLSSDDDDMELVNAVEEMDDWVSLHACCCMHAY